MADEKATWMLSPGPHLRIGMTTRQIMWWVTASLTPATLWAAFVFGWKVFVLTASGIFGALLGEWMVTKLRKQENRLGDGSAVLTGLLLVGTISPGVPFWLPAAGSFMAIVFAKMLFGGLGYNIFNQALIGRAFLTATFPVAMTTTWQAPFTALTHATPLNTLKLGGELFSNYWNLFLGLRAGSMGEVSVLLILLGGLVLVFKKIIRLYIPVSVIAGCFAVSLFSGEPVFHLLTGGLWFGAFYMATDYVTAPMMPKAQMIFGFCIGILTGIIRLWGGYPEGICYAILIMNAVTPALNHWFRPKRPVTEGAPS